MTRDISSTEYKIRKLPFIHHKLIGSFAHLTSIMVGMKGVKQSAKTARCDNKSEDLHDNPIYVVRTPKKKRKKIRFMQRTNANSSTKSSNFNYLDNVNAQESNIPYHTQKW